MPRIPITIMSGYLGAGKTTMINHVLAGDHGLRVAVFVNDFGAVNIDKDLIAAEVRDRISLTNGCVCCSIGDDLGGALDDLAARDDRPDHVLLEASGVAEPKRIAMQAGYWPGFELDTLIVAVDAETIRTRVKDKFVGRLMRNQIAAAEIIALTKADLIKEDVAQDVITFLRDDAPEFRIIPTVQGALPNAVMFGQTGQFRAPFPMASDEPTHTALHAAQWHPASALSQTDLAQALAALPPTIHRVKGFFRDADTGQTMLLQAVGARHSFSPAPKANADAIVMIGVGAKEDIDAALEHLKAAAR